MLVDRYTSNKNNSSNTSNSKNDNKSNNDDKSSFNRNKSNINSNNIEATEGGMSRSGKDVDESRGQGSAIGTLRSLGHHGRVQAALGLWRLRKSLGNQNINP